jgi:hypothetical protein
LKRAVGAAPGRHCQPVQQVPFAATILQSQKRVYDVEREKPLPPDRPRPQEASRGGSFLPVLMVLVPLFFLIVGVVALSGLAGLYILAVIASVPAFMLMHYLLWGYWLGKSIHEDQDEED